MLDELSAIRGRLSRVADTELIRAIAYLIRPPGSITGVGLVRRNQTKQKIFLIINSDRDPKTT